jgi:hypothetical protein
MRNDKVRAFIYMLATAMTFGSAAYWAWHSEVWLALMMGASGYFLGDEAVRCAQEVIKKNGL